jgi:hypothetical protein
MIRQSEHTSALISPDYRGCNLIVSPSVLLLYEYCSAILKGSIHNNINFLTWLKYFHRVFWMFKCSFLTVYEVIQKIIRYKLSSVGARFESLPKLAYPYWNFLLFSPVPSCKWWNNNVKPLVLYSTYFKIHSTLSSNHSLLQNPSNWRRKKVSCK